ncbi:cupin domain-containing protein [Methylocystis iwaonis]|uniref:cupin domain-containing protein n=1 Tax=Methylocystis iwaonis TaxID=2885079 RepID=UPI002E7B83F6|nr:cupin domain-containing protein [Methylocystis iwaonis]
MSLFRLLLMALLAIGAAQSAASANSQTEVAAVVARREIPNIPGKSLVSVLVTYAPGAKSPPHRHAASGFIYAYVLSGAIRSQTGVAAPQVYRAGESWFEPPGARHSVSENASDAEPARLLAIFVVDTREEELTRADQE